MKTPTLCRKHVLVAAMMCGTMLAPSKAHAVDGDGNNIAAGDLRIVLDTTNADVTGLINAAASPAVNHEVPDKAAPLISLIVEPSTSSTVSAGTTAHFKPTGWRYSAGTPASGEAARGIYSFDFPREINVQVTLVENVRGFATLEVTAILNPAKVDIRNVLWGPLLTDITGNIGDTVGVLSSRDFAIGMMGANAKTLGGWPAQYPDTGFRENAVGGDPSDWRQRAVRNHYEMSSAVVTDFGAILQAYTRDYTADRVYSIWKIAGKRDRIDQPVPALPTAAFGTAGQLVGSKVAIFGHARKGGASPTMSVRDVMAAEVLDRIGAIQIAEPGLPHPIVAGGWAKTSRKASAPYLILTDLSASNLAIALDWANDIGWEGIYKNTAWGVFSDGGDFDIAPNFGASDDGLRELTQTARASHIGLGSHSLSNWIAEDARIFRANPARLNAVAYGTLAEPLSAAETGSITVSAPAGVSEDHFKAGFAAQSGRIVIGKEILSYTGRSVSDGNLVLSGLTRGVSMTSASAKSPGAQVMLLEKAAYAGEYVGGMDMTVNDIGPLIARKIDLGLDEFSFDAAEWLTTAGYDQLQLNLLLDKVYSSMTNKTSFIHDMAVGTPFSWHYNSRYNWGETEDDITIAHQVYRWGNQVYFRRNYWRYPMMGWWTISDANEWRWALSKSAAFDAGFAYYGRVGDAARYSPALRAEIKGWHNARLAGTFDWPNRYLMQERSGYFKLDPVRLPRAIGPSWRLSDWIVSGPDGGSARNSRLLAPQLRGFPLVNLARNAAITASGQLDNSYPAELAVDNSTGVGVDEVTSNPEGSGGQTGGGEWAIDSAAPEKWVELAWDTPQRIRQIILFDREQTDKNVTSGTLTFSDGTTTETLTVAALDAGGAPNIIDFPEKRVTRIRFTIGEFVGADPGLAEIIALGPNPVYAETNLASSATVTGVEAGQEHLVRDGVIASAARDVAVLSGTSATLDLGGQYYINGLSVWHHPGDERTYKNVVFEISDNADFADSTIVFNADAANVHGRGAGIDADYTESGAGKLVQFAPVPGRYVRLWSNGSNVDGANHLAEVEVYGAGNGTADVAASGVTSNGSDSRDLAHAIDHDISTLADLGSGKRYLQIDLGTTKRVNSLLVMREDADMRTFKNVIYQLSDTPTFDAEVTTVFNSDYDNAHGLNLGASTQGEFQETANGHYLSFAPVSARYVRLYSNGSNRSAANRYREVLVGSDEAGVKAPPSAAPTRSAAR